MTLLSHTAVTRSENRVVWSQRQKISVNLCTMRIKFKLCKILRSWEKIIVGYLQTGPNWNGSLLKNVQTKHKIKRRRRLIWDWKKTEQRWSCARWHSRSCHSGGIQSSHPQRIICSSSHHRTTSMEAFIVYWLVALVTVLVLSLEAWIQMWWDAEEPLGSGNFKGGREEPDPVQRSRRISRREASSANRVLISASALGIKEVSYFWKACPLLA